MARPPGRTRGSVDTLPSGALRVRVNAGSHPTTGKPVVLTETVPPGPDAEVLAEAARLRLLDRATRPIPTATVDHLVEHYLARTRLEQTTRESYEGNHTKHIHPLIGRLPADKVDALTLDTFYAELERCRDHCTGPVLHHTPDKHTCDLRCRPHTCKPLAAWTVRKIHYLLRGAYRLAIRHRLADHNPVTEADPPAPPAPDPQPPTPDELAAILDEATRHDPDFATLIWLAAVTGDRRGENCGLRLHHYDRARRRLTVRRAIAEGRTGTWEKDTKTHQRRHIALDADTCAVLDQHIDRARTRALAGGVDLSSDAFLFTTTPDGSRPLTPSSVTQKYRRLVTKLGLDTSLHKLRHYSATELITSGVDIRTVAGRLGHGGGGTTTLKTYAAWVNEADQRAAQTLLDRMPTRIPTTPPTTPIPTPPAESPYEVVAAREHIRITTTENLPTGTPAPTVKQIATRYGVSVGTAHRALTLLNQQGLVTGARRGVRATILRTPDDTTEPPPPAVPTPPDPTPPTAPRPLRLVITHNNTEIATLVTITDPTDYTELRRLLLQALHRRGHPPTTSGEFELTVQDPDTATTIVTFVT
ncbi:hypothetical protein GCM10022243_51020 [Saccharothrix violaceirubra]|uniref:Integrase n=1 Tax=Saccharothrix violaceirubra TaxID=413306 RepID=A0A7W7WUB0_9PSEU|nr:tyrosine-type recombinase/integrase [Saccharothrix violaceirubra]MBB4963557.1 integrase [Saccharothrix violaceirubra]